MLRRYKLTGKVSYRKSRFSSRLILQVEVVEKTRLLPHFRNYPAPPAPPPPPPLATRGTEELSLSTVSTQEDLNIARDSQSLIQDQEAI